MNIPIILAIVSIIVWLFPPFKQYKTRFFKFFLINAISDPLTAVLIFTWGIAGQQIYPVLTLYRIYSLLEFNDKRFWYLTLFSPAIFFVFNLLNKQQLFIINSFFYLVIVLVLLEIFIKTLNEKNVINLYLIVFIVYGLISSLKIIAYLVDQTNGIVLYYISSFVQSFFGIFFALVNVNTKSFSFVIRKSTVD